MFDLNDYDFETRRAIIAIQRAQVRRVIRKFLARPHPIESWPTIAAIVFYHEAVYRDLEPKVAATQVGSRILNSSESARSSILLAVLKALARAPLDATIWKINISEVRFVHDYYWGALIKAILRRRLKPDENFLIEILDCLAKLANRFDSYLPNSYHYPFPTVVRFVDKNIRSCSLDRMRPATTALLNSIKKAVARDLVREKGRRKSEAEAQSKEPGKWFVKSDREAIELIESWTLRQ